MVVRRRRATILTLLLFAVLVGMAGTWACRSRSGGGRVLVLGLDGMEPTVVDLLMSEGKLPNFARIRQEGAYGRLTSAKPLLSPVVWTTIATGKPPDQHHIGHFVAINPQSGEQLPVTSRMRRVKALWNILSGAGKQVEVVGWWATWPAETVRGSIVSDHLCYHFLMEEAGSGDAAGENREARAASASSGNAPSGNEDTVAAAKVAAGSSTLSDGTSGKATFGATSDHATSGNAGSAAAATAKEPAGNAASENGRAAGKATFEDLAAAKGASATSKGASGPGGEGLTYPPGLATSLGPMVKRPSDLTAEDLAPFVKVDAADIARPFDFEDDLSHFKWALATAQSYTRIGLNLWKEKRPDLAMVYVEGTDSTSHLFGHLFRAEGLSGELLEQQRRYGDAVEQMYMYADRILGDFIGAMDDRTTLVVLSDHGFQLGALQDDPSKTRDMRRVSERFHTMQGILYLYGHGVKPHTRLEDPGILDVAPTILALTGLAPARDMPGRVLSEALHDQALPPVTTYETGPAPDESKGTSDVAVDPQILEKLKSLGYLQATSPTGDRNLAAVLFEGGRYEESARAYEKLVKERPDDAGLRTSFAGALGALGKYDEAMRQLEISSRLDPLNPEAYHNRAVIYERQGNRQAAIREYKTALRYHPQYEPSQQALQRLGVSGNLAEPSSAQEKRAYMLAEEASRQARRGDYRAAMKALDEAERIAPRYALIYQYRSNVAYLMGDRSAAIAALQKGLDLEPDNALFRENLKNLKMTSTR